MRSVSNKMLAIAENKNFDKSVENGFCREKICRCMPEKLWTNLGCESIELFKID